jgi:urease subunit alpha
MVLNDALPKIEIDPETYHVYMNGERVTVKPAKTLPLTQLYYLR